MKLLKNLKNKGYNAMVDEAGVGGSGRIIEGIDPLIVFDSSILEINDINKISKKKTRKQIKCKISKMANQSN